MMLRKEGKSLDMNIEKEHATLNQSDMISLSNLEVECAQKWFESCPLKLKG